MSRIHPFRCSAPSRCWRFLSPPMRPTLTSPCLTGPAGKSTACCNLTSTRTARSRPIVFFADDDEAFQKMSSGFKADVVHPCAAAVPRYIDAGLIEPWDTSKIPEFANVPARMVEGLHQ